MLSTGVVATVDELWQQGQLRAATDASAAALELRTQPFRDATGDAELAQALHDHGTRCWQLARFEEAKRCLDRAFDLRETLLGDMHLDTLATLERLAGLANYQLELDLAEECYQTVVEDLRGLEGDKGMRLAIARRNYASHLRSRNQQREAREVMDQARKVMCHDAPPLELLALRKADAMLRYAEGDHRRALDLVEAALKDRPAPSDHPFLATARLIATRSLFRLDAHTEADTLLDELIPQLERGYGEHPFLAIALQVKCEVAWALKRPDEAEASLARAAPMYQRFYPDSPTTRKFNAELASMRGSRPP